MHCNFALGFEVHSDGMPYMECVDVCEVCTSHPQLHKCNYDNLSVTHKVVPVSTQRLGVHALL